ncbi:hypothetical protein CDL15_Pgr018287 [Punica granatum]|uniref:Uncharacterized protein n=1 Tax=Punica granatum TaxID=22663 RepID=A0A218WK40_PUNGR|nr:hypothetical protein CDL15_Pgr018287 [Punica granatum]
MPGLELGSSSIEPGEASSSSIEPGEASSSSAREYCKQLKLSSSRLVNFFKLEQLRLHKLEPDSGST